MKLFIAPHNDDEALFGAFTLIRYKPLVLVVTDSYIQQNRGEHITASERRSETYEAMKVADCPVFFGGIRDDVIDEWQVENLLSRFDNLDMVYFPAEVPNGNEHHNLISQVAKKLCLLKGWQYRQYMTYAKDQLYLVGTEEMFPTPEEREIKERMLNCYQSQLSLPATAPHFEAVKGKSEWFT